MAILVAFVAIAYSQSDLRDIDIADAIENESFIDHNIDKNKIDHAVNRTNSKTKNKSS